jgi:transposase
MRKSYDGLMGLIANHLNADPSSGQFFVFINRRKTHIKIFYFDGSGYCIWCKRLEQGQFNRTATDDVKKNWIGSHCAYCSMGLKSKK